MDSIIIPEFSYREFSSLIHEQAQAQSIPIAAEFELTRNCNLACGHCYCFKDNQKKELSFEEVCRILDELAQAGCLWLLFTGGEILMRPDFLDIYIYAKKKGFIICLFTNGTMLSHRVAKCLKEWPAFYIEISLYGATQGIYEQVTGVRGSFKRCIAGIELLLEYKLPLRLKTLVTKINKHQLGLINSYAREHGLEFKFDAYINPRLDGDKRPCQYRISPKEAVELDLAGSKRCEEFKEIYDKFFGAFKQTERLYPCSFGMWSFYITAEGILQNCLLAQEPSFDLRQGLFSTGWQELVSRFKSLKPQKPSECYNCDLSGLCFHCPAWAELENGDCETQVEFICKTAYLRHEVFKKRGIISTGGSINGDKKILQEARSA